MGHTTDVVAAAAEVVGIVDEGTMIVGRVGKMEVSVNERVGSVNVSDRVVVELVVAMEEVDTTLEMLLEDFWIMAEEPLLFVTLEVRAVLSVLLGDTLVDFQGEVDDFGLTLDEPLLVLTLGERRVLRVLLGDTVVDFAEVEVRPVEEVLGVALLVLQEVISEVEMTFAVDVVEMITVVFQGF